MNLCLKFEVYVCVYVDKIMNKIRLDQLCWIGEGIVGGCPGWVRVVSLSKLYY